MTFEELTPLIQAQGEAVAKFRADVDSRMNAFERALAIQMAPGVGRAPATDGRRGNYKALFALEKLDDGGFAKGFNEFLEVVHSGRADGRLKLEIQASMGESIPGGGGFAVPSEFAGWLLDASLENEIVRPRATVWPMKSASMNVPAWDSKNHTAGLFGGFTGTWLAENSTATEVVAAMRQLELIAKKLACYTSASNELVADGITFEQQLSGALVKTIGWYLDYSFLQGTGVGMPRGVINDPALVTVSKLGGQQAKTIMWENITQMYARLAPQCMAGAIWIANQTCVPQLLTMGIQVGLGGAPIQPAVMQSNGQFSLLGKPLFFTEKCPALGSLGQLLLADLSQYAVGLRKDVALDKSNAPGWLKDESSYRAILRADGMGTWDAPITPKAGDSLSWCVALAA